MLDCSTGDCVVHCLGSASKRTRTGNSEEEGGPRLRPRVGRLLDSNHPLVTKEVIAQRWKTKLALRLPDSHERDVVTTASQGKGCPEGTSSVTRVFSAFTIGVGAGRRVGDRTLFACPVHGDTVPTVTVSYDTALQAVDVRCVVGCVQSEILAAVGLSAADLRVDVASESLVNNVSPASVTIGDASSQVYTYLSAVGERVGQTIYGPSDNGAVSRLRRWNPATARWASGDFGAHLYRRPEVRAAAKAGEPVWILGSEADVHRIADQVAATCAFGGWKDFGVDHVAQLESPARVVLVVDRSVDGYRHAVRVRDLIAASGPSTKVTVMEPAVGMTLEQHLTSGRALAELVAIDPVRQLTAPADPAAPTQAPAALAVASPGRRGGRGGGDDDGTPNRAPVFVHRHGQTVQVRSARGKPGEPGYTWYDVIWTCEVRVRKITYQDLAEDPDAQRVPGSWLIELRRRVVDDSGHFVVDKNSIDGFAYETATATIAAEDFHTPGWPDLLPWTGVVANETPSGRAKARAAAVAVSGIRSTTPAFAATGWRVFNGSAIYVHPGGAIGDSGELMGEVTLDLPARFTPLKMSAPVPAHDAELLAHAVSEGLDPLLTVLPPDVAAPLIGYAFRTFMGKPRGSIHLMGAPGTGKTVAARVCGLSWTSTSFHEHGHTSLFTGGDKMDDSMRALALLMHSAKDALLLVDEFKGRTAQERVNALHTLFWNGQERSVSTTRGQIRRSSGPPRCGLVTTGEVGSVGSSATRTLTMALNRDVVSDPVSVWSELESAGSRSWRAQLGASFVQWLAADNDAKVSAAQRYGTGAATAGWQQFCASLPHTEGLAGRLVAIAADITVGWSLLLQFLIDRAAITAERADQIWQWAMGGLAAQLRAQDHSVGDGAEQLLSLVREAMTSGAGHATDRHSGEVPVPAVGGLSDSTEVARAFGWVSRGPRAEAGSQAWSPRGNHLGVVDPVDQMLYLFPRETLATMSALTARVGEHFTATAATITSALGRRGWLGIESDGTRRSRIRVAGVLTAVWPVPLAQFYGQDSTEAHGDQHLAQLPVPPWSRPRIVSIAAAGDEVAAVAQSAHEGAEGEEELSMTQEMLDLELPGMALTVLADSPCEEMRSETGDLRSAPAQTAPSREHEPPDDVAAGAPIEGSGDPGDHHPGNESAAADNPPPIDTGQANQDSAPVALRPLTTPPEGGQRWLYASGTVTDRALVLPDGREIPISIGEGCEVEHLGNLVDLAASLRLGSGGGRSMPEPPQLLLTKEALAKFGVTIPDVSREFDPFEVIGAAGTELMKKTVDAGYQTSKGGALRVWTRVWRGSAGVEFALLPVIDVTDPNSDLLTHPGEPVDMAYRLHRLTELLGTTYSTSGAVTGRRLYERLHPPGGRALTPTELVRPPEPFLKTPGRLAAGAMVAVRSLTADEQRHRFIHGYDLRANYLTAAQKARLGMGVPEHHREGIPFDPKLVGLWRVSVGPQHYPGYLDRGDGHVLLPSIMQLARGRDATSGWFTTPTLKYVADELDWPIEVQEAYTWSTSRRLLETWAKHVNSARVNIVEHLAENPTDINALAAKGAIKAVYTGFVGRLNYSAERDEKGNALSPWHRPDWRAIVQAEANVDLHRKIRKIAETTGRYPVGVIIDEVIYTSDEPDPIAAKPEPMPLGIGLGQWDVSRSHEIPAALIDLAASGSVSDFDAAIPKNL